MTDEIRVLKQGKYLALMSWNTWEYVKRLNVSGITIILAVTRDGKIVLVEQFRAPLRKKTIELPAGLVGDVAGQEHEDIRTASERELLEETGYRSNEMAYLTEGPPSPGCNAEHVTFFHAKGLEKVADGGGDAGESITVHEVPLDTVHSWLEEKQREGIAVDPKIFIGLYFADRAESW